MLPSIDLIVLAVLMGAIIGGIVVVVWVTIEMLCDRQSRCPICGATFTDKWQVEDRCKGACKPEGLISRETMHLRDWYRATNQMDKLPHDKLL